MSFFIEIPRRNTHCCVENEPFEQGMEYYSLLTTPVDSSVLQRQDFCVKCWEKQPKEVIKSKTFWKSKIGEKKKTEKSNLSRDEKILALLKEYLAKKDPELIQESFFLAIYLARRRRLYLRNETLDSQLYEVAETEEMLPIKKVNLTQEQIAEVQEKLAEKIKSFKE